MTEVHTSSDTPSQNLKAGGDVPDSVPWMSRELEYWFPASITPAPLLPRAYSPQHLGNSQALRRGYCKGYKWNNQFPTIILSYPTEIIRQHFLTGVKLWTSVRYKRCLRWTGSGAQADGGNLGSKLPTKSLLLRRILHIPNILKFEVQPTHEVRAMYTAV